MEFLLLQKKRKKHLQNNFFVWNHNHGMKSHLQEVTEEKSHWTSRLSAQAHSAAQAPKDSLKGPPAPVVAGSCLMQLPSQLYHLLSEKELA